MTDYREEIRSYIQRVEEALEKLDVEAVNEVVNVLEEARAGEAQIYVFGNGGSAATASHFCCDFNKGVSAETAGLRYRLHCLSDNVPTMTAIANDIAYEEVFREQLRDVLKADDLVVGISGSGNSRNVVHAAEYAKEKGCRVVGVTGYDGGELKKLADYHLDAAVNDMQISEDIHMVFDHLIMTVLRRKGKK